MTDIVINSNGANIPDTQEIYNEIADEWNVIFDGKMQIEPSTPQGQMITSLTAEVDNKNKLLNYFINQINPKTNEGVWQDAIANIFFLERKGAESSSVVCQCVGLSGTVIPVGSLVRSSNGDMFRAVGNITLNITGTVDGTFESVEKGLIPVVSNTINEIVSTVPGWDTVNNSTAGSVGRLQETRLEFEKRRSESQAKNGKGTVASLYARIGEVADVLDIYCTSNRTSSNIVIDGLTIKPHSVYCSVLGGTTQNIANVIENTIGAGDDTTGNTSYTVIIPENNVEDIINFQRPTAVDCEITVTLQSTPTTPFGIEDTIKDIVFNDFYGIDGDTTRVGIGETVYASRFYRGIADISGISIISVKICEVGGIPADFIYIPIDKYGALDKDNIIVNIEA